jgi:hypothetical protein
MFSKYFLLHECHHHGFQVMLSFPHVNFTSSSFCNNIYFDHICPSVSIPIIGRAGMSARLALNTRAILYLK